MKNWRKVGVALLITTGLVALASEAPAGATSSTVGNATKTISCFADAKAPTFARSLVNPTVTVTGNYRVSCKQAAGGKASSVIVNVSVSVVELDTDRYGKFTVIDTKAELAEYSTSVTVRFGSTEYADAATKSFTCVNTDTAAGDSEELATRVKISLVSGTWSS